MSPSVNDQKARVVHAVGNKGAGLPNSLVVSDPEEQPGYIEEGKMGDRKEVDERRKRWREGWYEGEYREPIGLAKGYEAYNPQKKKWRKHRHSPLELGRLVPRK